MFRTDQFSDDQKRQGQRRVIGLSGRTATGSPGPDAAAAPQDARLYQRIAQRIRAFIGRQRLAPGQRLPSERELATTLGVSRTSLREALIALELGGVIEVRPGAGAWVQAAPEVEPCVLDADAGPFECLSARRLIEPELAAMAARMADDAAIAAIRAAAADMEQRQSDKFDCEQADRNFHRAIARATGNSALVSVLECLWNQRGSLWHTLEAHFQTEELKKETLADHRRIVQAIAARDPAEARHAMRAHLERVTRTLSSG